MSDWFPNEHQLEEIQQEVFLQPSIDHVTDAINRGEAYDTRRTSGKQICMIMNQKENREGSEYDVACLEALFKHHFKMDVMVYNDPTKEEFIEALAEVRANRSIGLFVLVLMTHGREQRLLMKGGGILEIFPDVIEPLGTCPNLANKPKLLYVEACKGSDKDFGVPEDPDDDTESEQEQYESQLPPFKDTYYLRSTRCPTQEMRHAKYGTLFMQALCEAYKKDAHRKHIHKLASNIRILMTETSFGNGVQMASTHYDTLTEDLYLYCP